MEHREEIRNLITQSGRGLIFIHSDVSRVFGLVPRQPNMNLWLQKNLAYIENLAAGQPVVFPTFNYDFLNTGKYHPETDTSAVGALSEHARTQWSNWRSHMPVFNHCCQQETGFIDNTLSEIEKGNPVDPFDEKSIFNYLHENDGIILNYGAPFSAFTGIHHIEHLAGRPLYRYDKYFQGEIITKQDSFPVNIRYHVRPAGLNLNYRWQQLFELSQEHGLIHQYTKPRIQVTAFSYRKLADFWLDKIRQDPLFLLTSQSRISVDNLLEKLGRRFELTDFEIC